MSYQSTEFRPMASTEEPNKNCYPIDGDAKMLSVNAHQFSSSFQTIGDNVKFPNLSGAVKSPLIKSEILIKSEEASIPKTSIHSSSYASESAIINKTIISNPIQSSIPTNGQMASASACVTSQSMNKYMSAFDTSLPASIDDSYARTYSQQMTDLQHPYANGTSSYELARSYENAVSSMAFDRYDFNSLMSSQRPAMYPYLQTSIDDLSGSQQKYFQGQHQMATEAMLKTEHGMDGSQTPLYPRPVYHHYDQFATAPPPGFSAINLTVKMASAFKSNPTIGGPVPMMNIPTSNPSLAYNSAHFPVQRMSDSNPSSPRIGTSPNANCSPPPSSNLVQISSASPSYPNQSLQSQSFSSTKSPQTEPVDFSAPLRPLAVGFAFNGTPIGQTVYSRESTPDSAASPYIDSYRNDACGECKLRENSNTKPYLFLSLPSDTGNSPHPNYNGMVAQSDYSPNNYIGYGSAIAAANAYQCTNSGSSAGGTSNTNIGLNATTNGNGIVHNSASSGGGNPYAMATIGYPSVSVSGVVASVASYTTMPPPPPQHIPQHEKICTKDR